MNKFIKKMLIMAISIIFFSMPHVYAALNAGDIAFTQYNANNTDNFAFIALIDIAGNEEIKFTDNGWKSDNTWRTGEGIITWIAPAEGIAAGTIITISTTPSASKGTVSEFGSLNFAATGDQIIAYQNTDTMIAALNNHGSAIWQEDTTDTNDSALPQGLTNGTNAVALNEIDNAIYTGSITGDKATLLAAINDNANWTGSDNTNLTFSNQASCDRTMPITHCIHSIQGDLYDSLFDGSTVTIEGIVVGDFQYNDADNIRNLGGFFVQEQDNDIDGDANTSEGLFIYDGDSPNVDVEVGDKVQVTGDVDEYNNITELTAPIIIIIDKDNALPTAINIDLPLNSTIFNDDSELIADLEPYEGMLVKFPETLTISELHNLDRYGEFVASEGGRPSQFTQTNAPDIAGYSAHLLDIATRSLIVDDGRSTQNNIPIYPDAKLDNSDVFRIGDTVANLTGIIHYSRGSGNFGKQTYRLHPTENPSFSNINTRPENPNNIAGTVKAATVNLHNYFTTLNKRGANTASELSRQTNKLVKMLINLNADLIGLTELENNYIDAENSAIGYLVNELNSRIGADIYSYVDTGQNIGDDDIAVGILFKPSVFQQTAGTSIQILDDSHLTILGFSKPIFNGSGTNRSPLAVTFTQKTTDQIFTFVVAHMKSKSSIGNYPDDDDKNDGQGYSNQTRLLGVQALKAWLATDPTNSNDNDFLIVGDFNAYAKEDPIIEMEQSYTNIIGTNNYSYVYDGQIGTLDYAFASSSLNNQIDDATIWHINADEPDIFNYDENFNDSKLFDSNTPYRASDHDPIVIGLTLNNVTETEDNIIDPNAISIEKQKFTMPAPQPSNYSLFVAGTKAHIISQPSGINCRYGSGICSYSFPRGQTVKLVLKSIDLAIDTTIDDYNVSWDGDCGNSNHSLTMYNHYHCLVQIYGKKGVNYSYNSKDTPATKQLNFLNFSAHSLLRGGTEDMILGFILKNAGTTDIIFHAEILQQGVIPQLDLNKVLFDNNIGWYGNLLRREQRINNFNQTLNAGVYTIQMSSIGTIGRAMAGISLKNNNLNLTNLSVRGYLQDGLVLNFIINGEGTQKIKLNSRILSGQASTQLQMLNLATLQNVTSAIIKENAIIEVNAGAYAILLNALSGQGVGMIEVNLQ